MLQSDKEWLHTARPLICFRKTYFMYMSILSLFSVIPEEGIRFSHRWLLGIEFRTLEDQSVLLTLSHLSSPCAHFSKITSTREASCLLNHSRISTNLIEKQPVYSLETLWKLFLTELPFCAHGQRIIMVSILYC